LTQGRVERTDGGRINVFDHHGQLFDYLSGDAIRSWCVIDDYGFPISEEWVSVKLGDVGMMRKPPSQHPEPS
jgi:hypothetical protein